jgi:nitrate reductase delta subunit
VVLQAASVCLQYPDSEVLGLLPLVEDAVRSLPGSRATGHLLEFLATARTMDPLALQEHYVRTLDQRRRCCLYLTWWTEGETRRRGLALAELKDLYRANGFTLVGDELPDFLPVVLEFAAQTGDVGLDLIRDRRAAVELVRLALLEAESPYAAPVEAVCSLLPGPSPRDAAAARALARTGPPDERVGLETYGTIGGAPFAAVPTSAVPEGMRR